VINATGRTGQVYLENFDIGLAETIGAELIDVEFDCEVTQEYALRIPGVTGPDQYGGMVPVVFSNPEDVYQEHLLPAVYLNRSSIQPDMTRWFGGGQEYMVPVEGNPNLVERKAWTYPYNISYEVHVRARLRRQADMMFMSLGRYLWSYGQLFLTDSIGEERGYYAFTESIDSLDEVADIADRTLGHTFSIRVEGELDFFEPQILPAFKTLRGGVGVK
jgi:hypothetical protein